MYTQMSAALPILVTCVFWFCMASDDNNLGNRDFSMCVEQYPFGCPDLIEPRLT